MWAQKALVTGRLGYTLLMKIVTKKDQLDSLVETIEFTLISVIQGVALYFFINDTKDLLIGHHYESFLYIAIGFLLLCMFWALALFHIISFISWPINFTHLFLYFLVVTFEVLLFESISNPTQWFLWNIFFFMAVWLLFWADYKLLRSKKDRFDKTKIGEQFYAKLLWQQKLGVYFLVPAGIVMSLAAWYLLSTYPDFFIEQKWHLAFGALQFLVAIGVLLQSLKTYGQQCKYLEVVTGT